LLRASPNKLGIPELVRRTWAMADRRDQGSHRREYPPVYEKLVPIALGIIAVIIVVLLLVVLAVMLGLFPGS